MAISRRDSAQQQKDQDSTLDTLLDEARRYGARQITDREGNTYELHLTGPGTRGGPRAGEKISEWLKRTLPPGDPIDDAGLRNPTRAGLDPEWLWRWRDEDDDGGTP